MLKRRQLIILSGLGVACWLADVACIRLLPGVIEDSVWGDLGFLFSVPVAWMCARFAQRLAGLDASRSVVGVTLMVAVAALLHGVAFRWVPALYGGDHIGRLGGAWLLWIYSLILGFALLVPGSAAHARARSASA